MHSIRSQGSLALLLLLVGCGAKAGGDGEASSGGGTDETLGNSSAPEAPTGTDAQPEPTGGEASTSGGSTGSTGVSDAESSAGSGFSTGVPESTPCDSMCETAVECGHFDEVAGCVALCLDKLTGAPPACSAASEVYLLCAAGLTCAQLEDSLNGGLSHPCNSEQIDRNDACSSEVDCDWGAGGDMAGSECSLFVMCPGQPEREMRCDAQTCVCLEAEVEVGSCPAEDACLELGALQDKGPGCCGFPAVDP